MGFDGRLLSGMSVLAAVVETGSFTRAGEVLGLSASGVSRAVSRLEGRLGIRLLDRTTRALHLTGEGARLYELAAPHLSGIEEAANVISGAATTARGALRVSLNPLFSRHVLAPRLPQFKERYPELELISVQLPDAGDLVAEGKVSRRQSAARGSDYAFASSGFSCGASSGASASSWSGSVASMSFMAPANKPVNNPPLSKVLKKNSQVCG